LYKNFQNTRQKRINEINTRTAFPVGNLGFSMFQDRLGPTHRLVRIARLLEVKMAAFAQMRVCVSAAMRDWLQEHFDVQATVLYDRPPRLFLKSLICLQQRHDLLLRLGLTDSVFPLLESGAKSSLSDAKGANSPACVSQSSHHSFSANAEDAADAASWALLPRSSVLRS
jgi:hypothetical protein